MVQPELHPQDDRREGDGNPGQPIADPTTSGVPEAVVFADPGDETAPVSRAFDDAGAAPWVTPAAPPPTWDETYGWWFAEFRAWVSTLWTAGVHAALIVTFVFQIARVEGLSMAPTLRDQDRLWVDKLVFRISHPTRGDIVMLYYPIDPDKSFVKRVIGEPGDTVRVVDGRVYVNDVPLRDDFVPAEYRSHDDWGPQVVPEAQYFVMGDHRNNSSDSRHWGFVPRRYILGKVRLRWWPVPNARIFQ